MRVNVFLLIALCSFQLSQANESGHTFDSLVEPFLSNYCLDCHDADVQKGDIALDELYEVTPKNAVLWKSIWEQVALSEMPPRDKKNQPEIMQRFHVANWITSELEEKMKDIGGFSLHYHPTKANHLPHDLLFGEIPQDLKPSSTPARIWRIHPNEHLVRLNALINIEPEFDPTRPGRRTAGDHIPWNNQGQTKVFYGVDRIRGWVGGSAAIAAAITGFPAVLSEASNHGLRNYPILYSVNGAEATQIANHAENIVRFMAWGPKIQPYQIDPDINPKKNLPPQFEGIDIRGTVESLFYRPEIMRPLTPVYELAQEDGDKVSQEKLQKAVEFLFEELALRPPTDEETAQYVTLANQSIEDLGKEDGIVLGLAPIFLDPNALFRPELADYGTPDEFGRVMLQGWELAMAINAAFSYISPDDQLVKALHDGNLKSREDVDREVVRILGDPAFRKPRILQFFREYFDYEGAGKICKDDVALKDATKGNATSLPSDMNLMVHSIDRLIELVLEEDKNVLRELLTTNRMVTQGNRISTYFSQWESLKVPPKVGRKEKKKVKPAELGHTILPKGKRIYVRAANRPGTGDDKGQSRTLTTMPEGQRMGILTHPAWLVAQSDAMDNHAIHRGKWIREHLLGDAVPDVPITVDAQLPDEPGTTLRERMRVTRVEECWRCHQKMDPLGTPFEMYNHMGLYRTTEFGKPVDASGAIINSGDPSIDGPVENALEMIEKLANSERVEQVFVRHAFRFWVGRNETVDDAPVLQAAWKAYRDNEGSFSSLLQSLLTSDAFLYRTQN